MSDDEAETIARANENRAGFLEAFGAAYEGAREARPIARDILHDSVPGPDTD